MESSTFALEKELMNQGFSHIIGTDEVGRGPLCGPVLACAVMFKDSSFEIPVDLEKEFMLIRDSKKLSEKQREKVFDLIHQYFHVGIGLCDHETIDRINILEASFLSMKKAVQELQRNIAKTSPSVPLLEKERDAMDFRTSRKIVLVDGNKVIPNFSYEQKAVVGGDRICKSISAASIVAKVTRDRMMMEFHAKYPNYGLDKHKGYGTKQHMDALATYGPCPIHRQSFAPVRKCLNRA